jgi:hypothetical protein
MPMSPADCRKNAQLCLDLAKKAAKLEHAQNLRNIAKAWLKLADELEPIRPASKVPQQAY